MPQQYQVWYGPFNLDVDSINSQVITGISGTYVLGYRKLTGGMDFRYVGRSDEDLSQRLIQWVGEYPLFYFLYCENPSLAYRYECENYHVLPKQGHKLDNNVHPAKPENHNDNCHHCGQ